MPSSARTSREAPAAPPRFRVEAELARGGMGVVYRAYDELAQRAVALKRPLTSEARHLSAFAREYRTLVSLKHPRIIDVYDYGIDAGGPYYTMELLDGADLRARCPLPWREACAMLRDVASSLALLHARSLLHRDVSPLNVRLTADRRAKLLDFGALAPFGRQEHVVGTAPCLAPEVLDGASLDQRVDLYALGAVAYYALTGRHAFDARAIAALRGVWASAPPPPPSKHAPDVPPLLDELVLSLLALDPLARPTNAAEVIDRLAAIAELPNEHDERVVYSYFRHPRLVGRDETRARLEARLARLLEGQGSAVLVEGDTGFGKTAMVGELEREARLAGALVLSIHAGVERSPFAVLRALIDRAELELGQKLPRPTGTFSTRQSRGSVAADNSSIAQARAPFDTLAAARPLVLVVDDVEHVDTGSLAVLITIAKGACANPVLLVLSAGSDGDDSQVALRPLRRHCQRLRLAPLSACDIEELVRSIFADVPGLKRLAGYLASYADGCPLMVMETLSELVERRQIRYADGAWVLPQELPSARHGSLSEGLRRRVKRAGSTAERLGACLSVEERPLDGAFCLRAAAELGLDAEQTEAALGALVQERVLIVHGESYAFTHAALRRLLYAGLDPGLRTRMHALRAAHISARAGDDMGAKYAAAAHYALAGELEAAELRSRYVEIARYLDQLIAAVPDILTLYEREPPRPDNPYHVLRLSFPLLIAGLYIDPSLHDRLGNQTTDLLERRAGMALARRCEPVLGSTFAVLFGILVAYVWFLLTPRARRWQTFSYPLAYFGACASMSNQATLRLDVATQSEVMARLAPVAKLPRSSAARLVYDGLEGAAMYLAGRLADAHRRIDALPGQLAIVRDMDEGSRVQYMHSFHFWAGRSALTRTSGAALEHAAALDRSAVYADWIGAQFLRTAHHLARGELAQAEAARDLLDELTARYGQNWSADVMLALEFPSYALSGDVVGLKRAVHQLEGLMKLHPSLGLALEVARAMHEGELGRPMQAVARYQQLGPVLAPFKHFLWSFARGHWARCLNELGRHAEARTLCAEALSAVGSAADEFVSAYQELAREHAMARAGLGELPEACAELDALLATHGTADQPLIVGLLHRDRARLAARQHDAPAFARHLAEARVRFAGTRNPALRSQLSRLMELAAHPSLAPELGMESAVALSDAVDLRTIMTSAEGDGRSLEQRLVEHLAQLAGAERARLYTLAGDSVRLSAECGSDRWPAQLAEEVRELHQGLVADATVTTALSDVSAAPSTASSQPVHRLYPLFRSREGERVLHAVLAIADAARPETLTAERLEAFVQVLDELA